MNFDDGYKLFNILITSFFAAGGLGFINYYVLERLSFIRQAKDKKDEKALLILFFSIVNYATFLFVFSVPNGSTDIRTFIVNIAVAVVWTLVISLILSFTLYPIFSKLLVLFINWFRARFLNASSVNNLTPKEDTLAGNSVKYLYIFDFTHEKLGEGYLAGWTSDLDKLEQIVLGPPKEILGYTYEEVEQLFAQSYDKGPHKISKHIIDYSEKLHYFVFYQ